VKVIFRYGSHLAKTLDARWFPFHSEVRDSPEVAAACWRLRGDNTKGAAQDLAKAEDVGRLDHASVGFK
jgi:hypothetical protein